MKKQRIKLHFNRVNMQRNDRRVWSAHTSTSCNMSEQVVVMHEGRVILETVFNPEGKQPRAYLATRGVVSYEGGKTIITV